MVRAARRRGPDYKSQEASQGGARGTHAGSSRAKRDHILARTPQPLPGSSQEVRGGRAENSIVRAGFPVASLVTRTSSIVVVVNTASTKFLPSASSPPASPAPPPPVCNTPLGSLRPHCEVLKSSHSVTMGNGMNKVTCLSFLCAVFASTFQPFLRLVFAG